ncbi:Arc family DNA-binding protein [Morganella morganii]|uniref:Arc family DNA-binding protein n=1 Tax=Morganella morganii TaxID=582 RepID=UPI0034E41A61|nr:Arc family DNA-binding protein [Morganella sp. HSTU-ASny43]
MMNKSKTINPMQLRMPDELKDYISKSADKCLRTLHSEVLYRLMLLREMEEKGEVRIQ